MSNAMRFGKRTLAGVAAGALALGTLAIASAPAATAAKTIKPKATSSVTSTVTPVRVTFTPAATREAVPYATVSWTSTAALTGVETVVVNLKNAPSPSAILGVSTAANAAAGAQAATASATTYTNQWDTAILGQTTQDLTAGVAGTGATGSLGFAANEAGTYTGEITVTNVAGVPADINVVAFSFTTTGRATSMTLSPATASTNIGGPAVLTAELKDAGGNRTQPLWVDSLTLTNTGGATNPAATVTASALAKGTATVGYTAPGTAGSYSVTASPQGTLSSGGVTAQTSVITVSGSVATTVPYSIEVTTPANAIMGGTDPTAVTADVASGTSAITVSIDGGANRVGAGQTMRFAITAPTGGTVNGASTAVTKQYASATLDANGDGSFSFTLGGQALVNGQNTTVAQVGPDNNTFGGNANLTVRPTTAAVSAGTIIPSPRGSLVAALGATTKVDVLVTDQFENPQANFTVAALRGSTVLSTGVTNSSGVASVTVSQAAAAVAGTVETYTFSAQAPGGTITSATANLVITYTTGGSITSLTATASPAVGTTAGVVTSQPLITVPSSGLVDGAITTSTYNPSTKTATGAATAGKWFSINVATNPATNVTLTAPVGAKLLTTAPNATAALWSGGTQTRTVTSGTTVYVFATKTGSHEIQVSANNLSTTVPFTVINQGTDYYNMTITPATQEIAPGAFATATVSVTDVFGNPVTTTGTPVTVTATGEVLLGGLASSVAINTGTTGTATVTLIAGNRAGAGRVTIGVTPTGANAWAAGFVPPTGAPAPVTSGTSAVVVTEAVVKSITITGSRTTVSGKPGIRVDGVTTGIDDGKTVKPFFRFPGETSYSEGTARPVITDDEFTWQRKTGKKFYAYVTTDDGEIQSNRVIIPAN